MKQIVNFGKWALVLEELKPKDNPTMYKMSRNLDLAYSHFMAIIQEFEKLKWIVSRKLGRNRIILLTKKGIDMRDNVIPVLFELKTIKGKR